MSKGSTLDPQEGFTLLDHPPCEDSVFTINPLKDRTARGRSVKTTSGGRRFFFVGFVTDSTASGNSPPRQSRSNTPPLNGSQGQVFFRKEKNASAPLTPVGVCSNDLAEGNSSTTEAYFYSVEKCSPKIPLLNINLSYLRQNKRKEMKK